MTRPKNVLGVLNPSLVNAIHVELEAYVGSAQRTLDELSRLAPGDVVTLNSDLNCEVELRLNGVVIAVGELVTVDDRFAVKILEIATS